ncbi:hypothetical protein [Reyranella sp.]|uniref:hypothetical protein n=1 Tax=Reyranella sp. TaxID=1929291 RepID=UPI002F950965
MRPAYALAAGQRRMDGFDAFLFVIYLLGLYLGVALQITSKIPLTCAPSGFAGLIMLWRRRNDMRSRELAGLLLVVVLFLGSILSASDISFLDKRFTGLLQLVYSLVIGYAVFLTMTHGDRDQLATILLAFCLTIIVGCLLEEYGGLRAISDKVRGYLYNPGVVYDADLRDEILYGRIRPKLFTSEPSAVTFAYTHFSSIWLVLSRSRFKYLTFACLLGLALVVLPGPTLMLMLLLAIPYVVLLAGGARRASPTRLMGAAVASAIVLVVAVVLGQTIFAARLQQLQAGQDASFFYRFTGPMLVAFDMFRVHPWAGSGLTGEPYIADRVLTVFNNSAQFQSAWRIPKVSDVLTNYFWTHWIYLGAIWGTITVIGLSWWLRVLGATSVLYCWAVWAILGQASGSYVGPKTWAVLLIAAACSVLVAQPEKGEERPYAAPQPQPLFTRRSYPRLAGPT